MDTELCNLYAKYDELRDRFGEWNDTVPEPTGSRVLDFYSVNRDAFGNSVFAYAPLAKSREEGRCSLWKPCPSSSISLAATH